MLKIELIKEEKQRLIEKTQHFFNEERDEKLGVIAAEKILDFFVEELSKAFYNKGLDHAKNWFDKRLEELNFDYDSLYK
ncbi:MAG: DUF2164 domain-containing protein [Candidatus Margulisbacteria bacterium]|nr:DUF2164 domain-containing protein [Candidatus Margulisiibacteriota bacterium]